MKYNKESLQIAYSIVKALMENDESVRASYKPSFRTVLNIISDEYINMDLKDKS